MRAKVIMLETVDKIQMGSICKDPTFGLGQIILESNEECFYKTHVSGGSVTTPWKRNLGIRLINYHIYLIDESAEIKENNWYIYKERFLDGTVKTLEQFNNAKWIVKQCEKNELPYIERARTSKNSQNGLLACFKIIASTQQLKGVFQLSEQSIKLLVDYYNKYGKIPEFVEVEEYTETIYKYVIDYSEIKMKLNSQNQVEITIPEEKMYSREEVERLTHDAMKERKYTPYCVWQEWANKNL